MASVTLSGIRKIYQDAGRTRVAVADLDLAVRDGEFVVLVGPSGCGKSTTLRMVAGLEAISAGELRIGDRVVNDVPPRDRNVAMVFQNYALYPHMTVFENLAFSLKLRGVAKDETATRVREAARILRIDALLDHTLGATMLYVTHDQAEAMTLGDRVVVMRDGRVQQVDAPLAVYRVPRNTFVAGFIGSPPMNLLEGAIATEGGLRFIGSGG